MSLESTSTPASLALCEEDAQLPREVRVLTEKMTRGDEGAYQNFYELYYDRLLRYLLVVAGGNEDAAREALQATFVRIVRHIKAFPDEGSFWGWLTVLARSALNDQSRKRWRYLAFLDRFSKHVEVAQADPDEPECDAKILEVLEQSLASLPVEERELLTAKYYHDRSVREIAEVRQTTEKAVESRLSRVRRKLKAALLDGLENAK